MILLMLQKALYIDIGGGIMKYASTDKLSQLVRYFGILMEFSRNHEFRSSIFRWQKQ